MRPLELLAIMFALWGIAAFVDGQHHASWGGVFIIASALSFGLSLLADDRSPR